MALSKIKVSRLERTMASKMTVGSGLCWFELDGAVEHEGKRYGSMDEFDAVGHLPVIMYPRESSS